MTSRAVTAAGALLLAACAAGGGPSRAAAATPRLADVLRPAWMNEAFPPGSGEERSLLRWEVPAGDDVASGTAVLVVAREDLNREFYARADFPHGQKPLLPALRSTLVTASPEWGATSTLLDAAAPARLLLMSTSQADPDRGIFLREALAHAAAPKLRYAIPHDGSGSGERPLDLDGNTFFEEHLATALRALPFDEAPTQAAFALLPRQAVNGALALERSPAMLRTEPQGGDVWRVQVDVRDGRRLDFTYGPAPRRALLAFSHSDGRRLEAIPAGKEGTGP